MNGDQDENGEERYLQHDEDMENDLYEDDLHLSD